MKNTNIKKHFLKALYLDPQFSQTYYQLALIDNIEGDKKSAESHLRQAIKLDLIKISNIEKKANNLIENFQFQHANILFFKSQKVKNNCAKSYYTISSLYTEQNKISKAKECLIKSINLNPKFSKSHREIGMLYLKEKKMDFTKKHLNLSLELNYGDYKTHYYLGAFMIENNFYDMAEQCFLASLDIKPNFVGSLVALVKLKFLMKENKEARSYYKMVKNISKNFKDETIEELINKDGK